MRWFYCFCPLRSFETCAAKKKKNVLMYIIKYLTTFFNKTFQKTFCLNAVITKNEFFTSFVMSFNYLLLFSSKKSDRLHKRIGNSFFMETCSEQFPTYLTCSKPQFKFNLCNIRVTQINLFAS